VGSEAEGVRWIAARGRVQFDENGEAARFVGLVRDISDQKLAEAEKAELLRRANAANTSKDEFLAMLGHELRNPLSPILTALQLMQMRGSHSREQAVIERQVGSGEAVDPDVRDRPPIRIRADLITDRADGPIDRLECLQPAEPGVTGALPPSRSQDPAAPIEQHDVGLGVPAINRQDRGAHRFTHA